jgi:hypothetical protein
VDFQLFKSWQVVKHSPGSITTGGTEAAGSKNEFILLNRPKRLAVAGTIAKMWRQAKNILLATKNLTILYEN